MNGITADPACPKAAIQPIDPVTSHLGITFDVWLITSGYMGPMKRPITATYVTMQSVAAPRNQKNDPSDRDRIFDHRRHRPDCDFKS
jgi:hypothetical protein